jgi:hypothetical protein
VPLNEYEFPTSKLANVQSQLERLVEKNYYLHQGARDAYRWGAGAAAGRGRGLPALIPTTSLRHLLEQGRPAAAAAASEPALARHPALTALTALTPLRPTHDARGPTPPLTHPPTPPCLPSAPAGPTSWRTTATR